MAAGDFNASQLPKVLALQREIFVTGGRLGVRQNDPRVAMARAIFENQTAVPIPVMKNGKCTQVDVTWLKYCDTTTVDCGDGGYVFSCDITGAEGESVKQTLDPNICIEHSFTVNDDECNDAFTAEQKIAEGLVNAKLALESKLSQLILNQLYAGVTPATSYEGESPTGWDLTGTPYKYPSAATSRPLTLSQMYVMSQINRVNSPVMVGDGTWQADVNLAQFLNNQGGGVYNEAGLYGQWGKWYFDPINLNAVDAGVLNGKLLMIDPNNVLAWTTNEVMNDQPELYIASKGLYRWREPLMFVKSTNQQLYYDVYMQESCIEGANGVSPRKATKFRLQLRGGFHTGDATCHTGDDGTYLFAQA